VKVPVVSAGGARSEVDLAESVFGVEVSEGAIYHAIRNELANRRVGTASTKGRSEVRGTNRKPWRQKGTGRARAGDVKSPLWTGGGVIFGPQPRSYRYKLPRKAKRAAIRSILTQKATDQRVTVVDGVGADSGKTKDLVRQLEPITGGVRSVWLLEKPNAMLLRAGRNIPWLRMRACDTVTAHDLYYSERVLLTPGAAERLALLLGDQQEAASGEEA
jgi:large subunit ribosomal protein L4